MENLKTIFLIILGLIFCILEWIIKKSEDFEITSNEVKIGIWYGIIMLALIQITIKLVMILFKI